MNKKTKGAIGALALTGALVIGVPSAAQAASAVTSSNCVVTVNSSGLLLAGADFVVAGADAGTVNIAFKVDGDPGPIEVFEDLSDGAFPLDTSVNNSDAVPGVDTVTIFASYAVAGLETFDEVVGECSIEAAAVSNPPVKTPLGMESAPADPAISLGLTALVISLLSIPLIVWRSRRNATQR